jgi:hypothetical protein
MTTTPSEQRIAEDESWAYAEKWRHERDEAELDAAMREQMTHDPEEGGPRDRSIGEHPRFAEMDARRNARLGRTTS